MCVGGGELGCPSFDVPQHHAAKRPDMERVCVSQYWSKVYHLLYCVLGHVSSTCVNVPRDTVTANLSPRTPTSARGSECSCRTGGPRRVAPAPGRNTRGTRSLATGRLRPDCTSHVTSWVRAMSTATSQSMSSKSHCRIHFSVLVSWVTFTYLWCILNHISYKHKLYSLQETVDYILRQFTWYLSVSGDTVLYRNAMTVGEEREYKIP